MSRFLSTALLATAATAQLTTSIWMPGAANGRQKFVGSVIDVQNDRTTLKVAFEEGSIETEYYGMGPETVTVGGTTFIAYTVDGIDSMESTTDSDAYDFTATVAYQCSRSNAEAVPTCTIDTYGQGSDTTILPGNTEVPASTTTFSGDEQFLMNNFQLVITAGTEKLDASAAATPTASDAQSTAAQSTAVQASGAKSSGASATNSAASSGTAQSTGAAAPMRSAAPILAGLGAAAAFFF